MKELKLRTHGNSNLSKAIQDELRKLGYENYGIGTYRDTAAHYIYAFSNKATGHCSFVRIFEDHPNKEVTIYDLIEMNAKDSTLRKIRKELEEHNEVGREIAKRLKEEEGK